MSPFTDLKLADELLGRLEELGYHRPTALQREAVPVIARGTNAVGVATAGSGKTLAYGLGLAARLDPGATSLQALLLRPTDDAAAKTAESLHGLMAARDLRVQVATVDGPVTAHVAVASPTMALAAVEHSLIKLADLTAIVVDGAAAIFELDAGEQLETLSGLVPKDAQRVLLTSRLDPQVENWIERHARRSRRLVYLPAEVEPLAEAAIEYFAGSPGGWLPLLSNLLAESKRTRATATVLCRSRAEAQRLSERLAVRGIASAIEADDQDLRIDWREPAETQASLSVLWGAPLDLETLTARTRRARRAIVFVETDELDHLRHLAAVVELELTALKTTSTADSHTSIQATRQMLSEALRGQDLEPYICVIEPLLEEFTPVEVAAAATALLRARQPAAAPPPLPAWTRLYFAVGRRDGVRPADIVGAIAGESPASGEQIGRIEIRDTHSLVEIAAPVADRVIKSLARTAIRGRPTNVRVYRE